MYRHMAQGRGQSRHDLWMPSPQRQCREEDVVEQEKALCFPAGDGVHRMGGGGRAGGNICQPICVFT